MKHIKDTWTDKFKDEVHNLRLSIAIDGVNPFPQPNTTYTFWHVIMINKNTPPWFSMNNEHLMLALIVPSRRQVKNMEGIQVYDVSRPIPSERSFTLYGIYAYTTHDYSKLGVFSCKYVD